MADNYEVKATYTADVSALTAGIQSAISSMNNFTKSAESSVSKVTSKMSSLGKSMVATGAATTALGAAALSSYGDFSKTMNQAAVIAGGTTKDISGLTAVAKEMGSEVPVNSNEAAKAMLQMARDGASIGQIKQEFPAVARAATASGQDLEETANVVQTSMNVWRDSLKSPAQAAAILTKTSNMSKAKIEEMRNALSAVGGTASQAGISMQDTSTAVGLLTNKGFSAAQASQDLNHAILQMEAPSKTAKKAMDGLGISFTDNQGKMKSFPDILKQIDQKMSGLSDSQKQAALKQMFGTSGMGAISPLLKSIEDQTGNTATSWSAFNGQLQSVSGNAETANAYLKQTADNMQQNVGSKLKLLKDNMNSLNNTAMESTSGVTTSFLEMSDHAVKWATTSNNSVAKVGRAFVGLSPIIGPAVTGMGTFLISASKIVSVTASFAKGMLSLGKGIVSLVAKLAAWFTGNTAVAASSAPAAAGTKAVGSAAKTSAKDMVAMGLAILEIGAGIALVVAGFALLVLSITQLAKTGMSGVIALGAVTVAIIAIIAAIALLAPGLAIATPGLLALSALFLAIGSAIAIASAGISAAAISMSVLVQAITLLVNVLNNAGNVANNINAILTAIGTGLANMIISFVETLLATVPVIVQTFLQMILSILNAVATAAPQIINAFANMMIGIIDEIGSAIPRIISAGVDMIIALANSLLDNLFRLIDAGVQLVENLLTGIANRIPNIVQSAINVVLAFVNGVGQALGEILGSGSLLLTTFINGIFQGFSKANSSGKDASNQVKNGVSSINLIDVGVNLLKGLANGIAQGAADAVKKAVNVAKDLLKSVKSALGIHSPSRRFAEIGMYTMAGMKNGIDANAYKVTDSVTKVANSAMDAAQGMKISGDIDYQMNPVLSSDAKQMTSGVMTVDGNMSQTLQMQSDDNMKSQLTEIKNAIADGKVISIDGNKLVGATAKQYDGALGGIVTDRSRNYL